MYETSQTYAHLILSFENELLIFFILTSKYINATLVNLFFTNRINVENNKTLRFFISSIWSFDESFYISHEIFCAAQFIQKLL